MKKFFKLSILSAAMVMTIATVAPANSNATSKEDRFKSSAPSKEVRFNSIAPSKEDRFRGGATTVKLYCHYKILGRHYVSSISNDKDMNACKAASGIVDSNSSNY